MKFENLIKNFVKIEDKLAFNIFITIFMFVCSFVSYSEEPLHDICCDYIEVNTEIIDDCCVIINIYNPYCANFETVFLVQQYDSYSADFITQYDELADTNASYKLCPLNGETNVEYRIRIASVTNKNWPHCSGFEWIEGFTEFNGTVDLSQCCQCPTNKNDYLKLSVSKSRECPNNGCLVSLLRLDIPDTNSCYKNYQVKWGGEPISAMKSIQDDPINTISKCVPQGEHQILRVFLYKNGESNPDSACKIFKVIACTEETPYFDSVTNVCTPDCFEVDWEEIQTAHLEVPVGSGCYVDVKYTYRLACSPQNYQDFQILSITEGDGCGVGMTDKQLYKESVNSLIVSNPMGFIPLAGSNGCDTTWRLIKASCWIQSYQMGRPTNFFPYGTIIIHLSQCDSSECCVQQYIVCRDSSDNVTISPMGIKLVPNTENCIISGNELLPTVGPDGHIIGILNPDVCYNTCDWVDINYPQLLINKESFNSQNSEINLTSNSANGVTIDCISANVCDLKIEFYDLKGTLVQIHEESFNNTMQRIDISKLIKSNGLFMYKVYINNKLVQNGKIIK